MSNRLAIFVPTLEGGGAEKVTLSLAQGIAQHGYNVDLVLAKAEGPYLAEVSDTIQLVDLKASRVITSLPALVRYLQRECPHAMISVLNHANIIALLARRLAGVRTRLIVCEHITLSFIARYASDLRGRLMPYFIRFFYPWADNIVTVSKGAANDMVTVAGIPIECIEVIYNPVITPELRKKVQAPLIHPWFEPNQPPVLLSVGRLTAQKDFPTLIHAFAQVHQVYPSKLLIIGEGEDRPLLEELIKEYGLELEIDLPGFDKNPYPYMVRASAFILSSRWEALPTVLIEALFCGIPIVATDCPSGPREILCNGKYGQLVPVGDVAGLVKAIERVLSDNLDKSPQASLESFELENVVNQYLDLILES